jgi:hypothetical protein
MPEGEARTTMISLGPERRDGKPNEVEIGVRLCYSSLGFRTNMDFRFAIQVHSTSDL